ncbi:myrosinase 1-like [Aricia agestis]|uniref:myrosinase 1-like n=1 Tax=Aricia agestis TaxID=91739 RepID=UPI001C20479D|nr:myrosinase 1-like [Aricia agestis]
MLYRTFVLCILVRNTWSSSWKSEVEEGSKVHFPPWFKFGSATASHQIEGAWNASGKTPHIWDVFAHTVPGAISDGSNGDVACDSYRLWREDVKMAADLGLDFYRFSISWPRILPSGFPNHINEEGVRYYRELMDGLLEVGIEPVVTIYHWELPQSLQDLGGWTNPLVVDWYADYARVLFTLYADRVKTWITLNEPMVFCEATYTLGSHAPGILSPGIGNFLCNRHALLAHAKAWRIYDQEFRHKYHGKLALTNNLLWFEPDEGHGDEVAELVRELGAGMYSHPIYSKEGGWPPVIEKIIAERSRRQGYPKSRLPPFTKEEIKFIRGTYDFYGFNYYTARLARWAKPGEVLGKWPHFGTDELNISLVVKPEWKKSPLDWFIIYPEGIRRQMKWLKRKYGNIEIFIMENGLANIDPRLDDTDRVDFYREHLRQVLLSIYEDGVNVTGYTAWSLMDNYEWIDGYHSKFGLYAVDFSDSERRRTPRASAFYYSSVVRTGSLVLPATYTSYTASSSKNALSYITIVINFMLALSLIK